LAYHDARRKKREQGSEMRVSAQDIEAALTEALRADIGMSEEDAE
jgi:hypothetical protein